MRTVSFYGHSDDLVYVNGMKPKGGDEEFNVYGKGPVMASFAVGSILRVFCLYDGCWSFAVGKVDEDVEFPDWPMRITAEHPYSMRLEIDVPDNVRVQQEKRKEDR